MKAFRSKCVLPAFAAVLAILSGAAGALLGDCGPFTDLTDPGFCPFVLEIFVMGITTGTTPTTYSPGDNVTRLQMAAFLSRSVDRTLQRGSRRAALKRFWSPQNEKSLGLTTLGNGVQFVESDGTDVWVDNTLTGVVSRVRASDGKVLDSWTGAAGAEGLMSAMGFVFVVGFASPSRLYRINPSLPAGAVTTVASNLGDQALGIAFDGSKIWTGNGNGTVSIVTPDVTLPWSVLTTANGYTYAKGVLFDGTNIWITDYLAGKLLKLNGSGAILQTVTVGVRPEFPVFDGTNIWVPNGDEPSVTVVRASSGAVLATLTGNGLNFPFQAAFDGQRVLVTNANGNGVSLWKAADLTSLGSISTGTGSNPAGACSDGTNFWIVLLNASGQLARF